MGWMFLIFIFHHLMLSTCLFGVGLQLVSPGAWLTDMCQERYEVREKKSNKKVKWLCCSWCYVYFTLHTPLFLFFIFL